MKLSREFPELARVRTRMGAPLTSWTPSSALETAVVLKPQMPQGELASLDEVRPISGIGPLTYQGRQIVLYIKDTRLSRETLLNNPTNSRRFHIAECNTIEGMRRDNRFARYVWTERTEGRFRVEATDPYTGAVEEIKAELYVCKNCLDALYLHQERANWPRFSVVDFFRDNETFFHSLPRYTDITSPPGGYPRNWSYVQQKKKEQQNWVCESCKVCLSENQYRSLLHCHHKNGVTSDCRPENLQALCVECHNDQPQHGRFPPTKKERAILARLRADQGR